jgi:beta-phosphoglucomutase-like phosphatase (HAD superfamily)
MTELDPPRRTTFLFDVDNTLIDNDRAKRDLSTRIAQVLGTEGERRFWDLYEEVRRAKGLVNIPLILAAFGAELEASPELDPAQRRRMRFALADLVMSFPYQEYLFPGALEAVRLARQVGVVPGSMRKSTAMCSSSTANSSTWTNSPPRIPPTTTCSSKTSPISWRR